MGYSKKRIIVDGEKIYAGVHRIAFFEVHGYWPDVVMHTCDNPRCININHLIAGTNRENIKDRRRKGRTAKQLGVENGFSKFTDEFVMMIFNAYKNGDGNQYEIAARHRISQTHVSSIVTGRYRSDVTGVKFCARSRAERFAGGAE